MLFEGVDKDAASLNHGVLRLDYRHHLLPRHRLTHLLQEFLLPHLPATIHVDRILKCNLLHGGEHYNSQVFYIRGAVT